MMKYSVIVLIEVNYENFYTLNMLMSLVVVGHLRQSSVVPGNVEITGNSWKMAKNYMDLFGSHFVSFWKIIYCHCEFCYCNTLQSQKIVIKLSPFRPSSY